MIRKSEKGKTEERWQRREHRRDNLEPKDCRSCAKHLTSLIPKINAERTLLCDNIFFMIGSKRLSFEVMTFILRH